jgi:hypothetical protein
MNNGKHPHPPHPTAGHATQALVSIVEDGLQDTLHSIQAERCVIVFMKKDPLVFVAVGSHAEPEDYVWAENVYSIHIRPVAALSFPSSKAASPLLLSYQLHQVLAAVHRQILSVLTRTQLQRAMHHKANYDLRRLLGGIMKPKRHSHSHCIAPPVYTDH